MRRALQCLTSLCALIGAVLLGAAAAHAHPSAHVPSSDQVPSSHLVGHVDYAINSDARIANYRFTADHEQVVILQAWETGELRRLKRANPDVRVLMYQNASSAATAPSSTGQYSTGVSYGEAQAHGWLLDNTSGRPFTFEGYNWLYATDIGLRGYQRAWASHVIAELHSAPWDGVFIDDLNPTIAYHYPVAQVAKYPTNARYGRAMGRFVRFVGRRLRHAHELAIANIGSWSGFPRVVDPWLRSLSGAMNEEFVKWGTSAGSGYAPQAMWRQQLREVSLTQREHKMFIGITHSSSHDRRAALYGYATELLAGSGHAIFSLDDTYNGAASWFAPYGYRLGTPTGHYRVRAGGIYERGFSDGRVLVNPTAHTETVALGGRYSGSGLHRARRATLRPDSGLVLTRAR